MKTSLDLISVFSDYKKIINSNHIQIFPSLRLKYKTNNNSNLNKKSNKMDWNNN